MQLRLNLIPSKPWTPEDKALFKELYDAGLSCSKIAAQLGRTRNSVIGYLNRSGDIVRHHMYQKSSIPRPKQNSGSKKIRPKLPREIVRKMLQDSIEAMELAERNSILRCDIMELTNSSCRWIVTDGAPFLYCGLALADFTAGKPYCPQHARIAYREAPDRRQQRPFHS